MLAPSFALILLFVYGFILFTVYLSFTDSQACCRSYDLGRLRATTTGCSAHAELVHARSSNLAIFGALYIVICTVLGLVLAILLDQKIRGEGVLRPIYLYPMALSFIVTGIAWKWFLDPGIGLETRHARTGAGRASPSTGSRTATCAIYTHRHRRRLAVLRLRHGDVPGRPARRRQRDHQGGADRRRLDLSRIYRRIIIPLLRPVFLSAFVVLAHLAIKSYDLVVALTGGGPGHGDRTAGDLHVLLHLHAATRWASARPAAIIMLMMIVAIIVPYLYSELRGGKRVDERRQPRTTRSRTGADRARRRSMRC